MTEKHHRVKNDRIASFRWMALSLQQLLREQVANVAYLNNGNGCVTFLRFH